VQRVAAKKQEQLTVPLATAGSLPPRGSESRARYHAGAHHSFCVAREVLTVAQSQGELQAAWPQHTWDADRHRDLVCAYSGLLERSVSPSLCCSAPFEAMKHCSDPSAAGVSRGQACSTLCRAGCLCASLTSVSGYLCLGNVDR